jgi:D-glycero-alpha-D-manno-heptose-7-phosphate kinase
VFNNTKTGGIIITRTPFRISFLGGGTDIPDYFNRKKSAVLGATINKYTYITINSLERLMGEKFRISYSKLEIADEINDIKDDYFREILLSNIDLYDNDFFDIHTFSDLPSGSGIGSSSTFVVGMLNGIHSLNNVYQNPKKLAQEAIKIERIRLKEMGGWQDQIFAAFGGFNFIDFHQNNFEISKINIYSEKMKALEKSIMLFFTNIKRSSADIQEKVFGQENSSNREKYLDLIYQLAVEGKNILYNTHDNKKMVKDFGQIINESWIAKKRLSKNISNPVIDEIYKTAMEAGAWGGKINGAGGGGFISFIVPEDKQSNVNKSLKHLKQIDVKFEPYGSRVIFADQT